jgi:hypothetical protein
MLTLAVGESELFFGCAPTDTPDAHTMAGAVYPLFCYWKYLFSVYRPWHPDGRRIDLSIRS